MFLITLSSKHGQTTHLVDSGEIHERLRQIGLEWKAGDQFYNSEVILTIQPQDVDKDATIKRLTKRIDQIMDLASGVEL